MIIIGYPDRTPLPCFNEGILSDGLLYYIMYWHTHFLMLINIRSGIIITIISIATASFIAFMVSTGWHTYDFDIVQYFYSIKKLDCFRADGQHSLLPLPFTFMAGWSPILFNISINWPLSQLCFHIQKIRLEKEITERQSTEVQLTESENRFKKYSTALATESSCLRRIIPSRL